MAPTFRTLQVTPTMAAHGPLTELFIDRGDLASPAIADLQAAGVAIRAKACPHATAIGSYSLKIA